MSNAVSPMPPTRHPMACLACRARKVKCERIAPCLNCRQANKSCVFPHPTRTVNRPKKANGRISKASSSSTATNAELLERIKRLEALVSDSSSKQQVETIESPELICQTDLSTHLSPEGPSSSDKASDNESSSRCNQAPANQPTPHHSIEAGDRTMDDDSILEWFVPLPEVLGIEGHSLNPPCQDLPESHNLLFHDVESSTAPQEQIWSTSSISPVEALLPAADGSPSSPTSQDRASTACESFPFPTAQKPELVPSSISPQLTKILWTAYINNVDTCLKIVHKQTMEKILFGNFDRSTCPNKGLDAVIMAVYLSAIISMDQKEVQQHFCMETDILVSQFIAAVEQALIKADFLNTQELSTLQALVLFLYAIKTRQYQRYFTLIGVAFRIAQRLRLNDDSSSEGLSCLKREIRRRLWWQLLLLEELPEDQPLQTKSTIEFDTRLPLNINDSDLDGETISEAQGRQGLTDMTFCLIQYEVAKIGREIREEKSKSNCCQGTHQLSAEDAESLISKSKANIESQYLRYCAPRSPFSWYIMSVAFMTIAKRWLSIYLSPYRATAAAMGRISTETQDRLFLTSVQILEHSRRIQTNSKAWRWKWLNNIYFQWSITSFVLKELLTRPSSGLFSRAWGVVNGILNDWPESIQNSATGCQIQILFTDVFYARMGSWRPLSDSSLPNSYNTLGDRSRAHGCRRDDETVHHYPIPLEWDISKLHSQSSRSETSFENIALSEELNLFDGASVNVGELSFTDVYAPSFVYS